MVKSSSTRRNKPTRRRNVHARLDKLRTGTPHSIRRISSDPKNLPSSFEFSVRIRFLLRVLVGPTASGNLRLPARPEILPRIEFVEPTNTTGASRSFALLNGDLFYCACMRLFGTTLNDHEISRQTLRFAIGKVIFYGPLGGDSDSIRLQFSFPDETVPGFVGVDEGDRLKRAVVAGTPPRLYWEAVPDASDGTLRQAVELIWNNPNRYTDGGVIGNSHDVGICDVTVMVRRVAPALVPPVLRVTYIEDKKIS